MKVLYEVNAMRRSGQHAIISWIMAQFKEKIVFVNNQKYREGLNVAGRTHKIINYEDHRIDRIHKPEIKRIHKNILILRDPFNLYASRLKIEYRLAQDKRTSLVWIQHAKEYLNRHGNLSNKYIINYNRWFEDKSYRRGISNDLCQFWNDKVDFVPSYGNGSSFDKTRKKGTDLKVTERWKHYTNNARYKSFFTEEMVDLAKQIFDVEDIIKTLKL